MKTLSSLLLAAAFTATIAPAAEPTLAEIQQELALVKAKLELADTKLALVQKTAELAKLDPAEASRSAAKPSKPVEKKETAEDAVETALLALRATGIEKLNSLNSLGRAALLGANGVRPDVFDIYIAEPAKADGEKLDRMSRKLKKQRDDDPDQATKPTTDPKEDLLELERLLVSLGYGMEQKRAVAAKTEPDENKKKAAAQEGRTAFADVAVKTDEEVKLRNAGISFAQGFGVAFSPKSEGDDAALGTLIVRWNWLQRSAAAKWNRWVGENNADGDAQVPYRGKFEYWLKINRYSDAKPLTRRNKTIPEWTAFGPFFGTAIVGDSVRFGTKTERPYLVGLSSGWGFFQEASSLLYVDLGVTVSPTSGVDHSKFFAGVSFDALVLGKMLGMTRKGHLASELTDKGAK